MFKLKRSIGWNFPANDDGQENGLNDPGIETFKDHPLTSLAREVLQNSSDAAPDGSTKPVQVHFEKLEIPPSEFPGYAEFKKTLEPCAEYWKGSRSTEKFIKNALEVLAQDKLQILRISDFNTTGLVVGAKGDRTSDWFKLTKSVGASDKHAGKLGSFGIGKHATYACSDLRTVFYGTLDNAGVTAVQGVAKLVTHKRDRTVTTQGTGYFGVRNGNKPIREFDFAANAVRTEENRCRRLHHGVPRFRRLGGAHQQVGDRELLLCNTHRPADRKGRKDHGQRHVSSEAYRQALYRARTPTSLRTKRLWGVSACQR